MSKIIIFKQMHHIGLQGESTFVDWLMEDRDWIFENEALNKEYIASLLENTYDFKSDGYGAEEKVLFLILENKKLIKSDAESIYELIEL